MKRISAFLFIFFFVFFNIYSHIASAAAQSDPKKIYDGKKIKFIVHYGPGGGYDTAARTLAPFIEKYSGAKVIIRNIPGAGGLNGMNTLWKARPDGLTIGLISGLTAVTNQMADVKGIRFDLNKFTWLGRISPTPFVLATSAKGQYNNIQDVIRSDRPIKIGTTGLGNAITVAAKMTSRALGVDIKFILGFNSTSEIFVSIMRGDIDGVTTVRDTVYKQVLSGLINPLLYLDMQKTDMFPNTPSFGDLNLPQDKLIYAEAMSFFGQLGRLIAAPPKIKDERSVVLKNLIERALSDPGFTASSKKLKQDVDILNAEKAHNLVVRTLNAPPEIKSEIVEAFKKK